MLISCALNGFLWELSLSLNIYWDFIQWYSFLEIIADSSNPYSCADMLLGPVLYNLNRQKPA